MEWKNFRLPRFYKKNKIKSFKNIVFINNIMQTRHPVIITSSEYAISRMVPTAAFKISFDILNSVIS